ncbi:MAG: tRNA preQ1(34) S-adenosylmethionine ribosyltransferase-isomerase QueA [Beijerinckiaceae bacterium]|nr:MAG: tRNA preQ1(34) S-adenosylmethionine ribosyltransferase-isomerase QueA [Beijerinckiaceae bacterium]
MRVDLFDFDLPPERIALRPVVPRDASRMLVVDPRATQPLEDRKIRDLPSLLQPGDVLVVNDTRVIPARLEAMRKRGDHSAKIEILLHRRETENVWRAFARPAKKLKPGDTVHFIKSGAEPIEAEVCGEHSDGEVRLAFALSGTALDQAIETLGEMPLPPYIAGKRATDARDSEDYQTLFAKRSGAVAAPTASLHFTPELVEAIRARGVAIAPVTLHVGAGTFLPVKATDTNAHRMHAEWGMLSEEAAAAMNTARVNGGRIVSAGTTPLRLIETAAQANGMIQPFSGETDIFITPGYRFKGVDLLLTNFHLPKSTLFMLVSAFSGLETMRAAYRHAIDESYRFYSYGDACLLHRASTQP